MIGWTVIRRAKAVNFRTLAASPIRTPFAGTAISF
jgi:hypothetical protein